MSGDNAVLTLWHLLAQVNIKLFDFVCNLVLFISKTSSFGLKHLVPSPFILPTGLFFVVCLFAQITDNQNIFFMQLWISVAVTQFDV